VDECVVTYSSDVAREAARFFLWRRYLTKLGLATLVSLLICIAALLLDYRFRGTDWFFGFMGTIIGLNVSLLVTAHAVLPRAMARAISKLKSAQAKVGTNTEGFSLSMAGNTSQQDWSRVRYLWMTERFVVLGYSFFRLLHIPTEGMSSEVHVAFSRHLSPVLFA
jgi:hypothetical protein